MCKCAGCKYETIIDIRVLYEKCSECRRALKDGDFRFYHYKDMYERKENIEDAKALTG